MGLTRILSIDGGGMKGIIPATLLITLEECLKKHSHNPDTKLADYFDLIAGTSTGGILTGLYLLPDPAAPHHPLFSAKEACSFYLSHGPEIFKKNFLHCLKTLYGLTGPKYSPTTLENLLAYYCKDTLLSELVKPCLITSYDMHSRSALFFNQQDPSKPYHEDFFVRDILRATSAAPTYFAPAQITSLNRTPYTLVDGGTFANNPTLCALVEASKLPESLDDNDKLILSLGTGKCTVIYRSHALSKGGAIQWALPLLNIFTSGIAETVDCQIRMLYNHSLEEHHYLRIQPNFQELGYPGIEMDDASPEALSLLHEIGLRVAETQIKQLDHFAALLVAQSPLLH